MSSSYLPSGVKVSCTLMTVAKPQQLGISRKTKNVLSVSNIVWLNIDDKKISTTFVCKSPAKFWNGLSNMLTGLAIGIICVAVAVVVVAAVVGTGGVAGVILAGMATAATSAATVAVVGTVATAAIVTAAVQPVRNLIGNFTSGHACDCTLETGSKWRNQHLTVKFNGQNAIVQKSILKCINGGMVQPFISPVLAQTAADKFSTNNNKELDLHNRQQLWMGFVSGFSGLADPLGTSLGIATGIYDYSTGYNTDTLADESAPATEDLKDEISSAKRDQKIGVASGTLKGGYEAIETITSQNRTIIREVMDQGGTYAQAERMTAWGLKSFKGEFANMGIGLGVGIGFGVAGAITNHYIAKSYKDDKLLLIEDVKENRRKLADLDMKNTNSVIASQK